MNKEISRLETVSDTIEDWLNYEFIVDDDVFEALENALAVTNNALQRARARDDFSYVAVSNRNTDDWSSEVL